MNINKTVHKKAKKLLSRLFITAAAGLAIGGTLAGCSALPAPPSGGNGGSNSSSSSSSNPDEEFAGESNKKQQNIISGEELSFLRSKGNLLAIQADKKVQHINATQHQRYPIPYTRSHDGNYWSWFTTHYLPKHVVNQVLYANRSDASDSPISDPNQEAAYDSKKAANEIQKNLSRNDVNYGINYMMLGASMSNALSIYQNATGSDPMPVKYYTKNTHLQNWANEQELDYLKSTGNAKAKAADKKIQKLDSEHHQKYPIPYVKSQDGNYWSWYLKNSIPQSVIKKFYKVEKGHDNDYSLNNDAGYIANRFTNDIQYNLMKHNVDYGVNYSHLTNIISNKYSKYEAGNQ